MRLGRIEQQGTPSEIHGAPRTRFVAGFFGMKNILDAELPAVTSDPDRIEGRVGPGVVLRARDPWYGNSASRGTAIGFRPGDVKFLTDLNGRGEGVVGTIERVIFLGDVAHYFIRTGALEICAQDRPRNDVIEGQRVLWKVATEHCIVLRD